MTTAVKIEHVSKRFKIGALHHQYPTFRDKLTDLIRFRRPAASETEIWAVDDLSLEINAGEVVGLIGRNGAGKSTLLKILSRITEPTSGRIVLNGRLASLLEVGTGFHPELTGRENIFLNGAILGMTRAEVRANFDAIVAFAEIDKFIDTPVKRYSSGMYVRLAFAVAAHLTPEILLVDEVLAVGDAAFQKKCLGRMRSISQEGRTVIIVSHNMSVVNSLCERAIWLDRGRLQQYGDARSTIGAYLSSGVTGEVAWRPVYETESPFRYREVRVHCDRGEGDAFPADAPIKVVFDFEVSGSLPPTRLAFLLLAEDGEAVLSSASTDSTPALNHRLEPGPHRLTCTIPASLLRPGRYFVTISEPTSEDEKIHDAILNFTVTEQGSLVSRDGRTSRIVPLLPWDEETS